MFMKPSWRFLQLVILIGCPYAFRRSDCLVLNAINGQTFSPFASAEFECIIDPYTNSQRWYVDSISVADCGIMVCSENASNPARYSFTPNTSAGNFIFKIDPISLEDNGNVIRCFDGTNSKETSISFTDTVTTATTSKTGITTMTTHSRTYNRSAPTNYTASIPSMSILRNSTPVTTAPHADNSYIALYVALALFVILSMIVILIYCFFIHSKKA